MTTRINLPDGSVVNVPAGVSLEQAQAEIERYLAQSAPQRRVMTPGQNIARDVDRLRDTVGRGDQPFQEDYDWQGEPQQARPREIPLNAMEQQAQMEAQRRGPQSRPVYAQGEPVEPGPRTRNGPRADEMPMNAMEQEFQREVARRGPPRRNAEISIREAIEPEAPRYQQPRPQRKNRTPEVNTDQGPPRRRAEVSIREASDNFEENFEWSGGPSGTPPEQQLEKDPSEMTNAELRAAEIAARSPVRELATDAAEAFTGGVRSVGQALQERAGRAAAGLGMTNVGARLLQGAEDTAALSERRRQEEVQREAAAATDAQRFADERARRAAATQSADQSGTKTTADGQPVMRPATAEEQAAYQAATAQAPQMPRAMSVQGAREQQLGAASQAPLSTGQAVPAQQPSKVGKAPPAAVKNAVRSGVDYMEQNMDQVVFGLLRQGKVQQARDFQEFMAERKTLRGMEETNRSYVALHYRDEGLWTKSLAGMVDNLYPDGEFEIDTKGTRFMRDDDGEVVGGIVSIRNKETGEVFEQEYIGMESLMRGVAEVGMPDAAYEYQKTRVEEARTKKIENAKNFTSAYDAAVELLFPDGFVDSQTMRPFTPEQRKEADRAIREYIATSRPDLPQPAPRQAPVTSAPQSASGLGSSIRSFFGGSTGDKPVPTMEGM